MKQTCLDPHSRNRNRRIVVLSLALGMLLSLGAVVPTFASTPTFRAQSSLRMTLRHN
jgi:hypothetical protein